MEYGVNGEERVVPGFFPHELTAMQKAWRILREAKKNIRVAVIIPPAVRTAIGESFALARGEDAFGKIAAALRMIGADVVVDGALAVDYALAGVSRDLSRRMENGTGPLIVAPRAQADELAEKYPELSDKILGFAPALNFASLIKKYYNLMRDGKKTKVIVVAPSEVQTDEDVLILTTRELSVMLQSADINVRMLRNSAADGPFVKYSGAGVLPAVSGGLAEALVRTLLQDRSEETLKKLEYSGLRGRKPFREAEILADGKTIRVAVACDAEAVDIFAGKIAAGTNYDLAEISPCIGGCIAEDAQPAADEMTEKLRAEGIYRLDRKSGIKSADQNDAVIWLDGLALTESAPEPEEPEYEEEPEPVVEEPAEVVEETEAVEEPVEVVEETETAEEPVEVAEETEAAEEPVEAVEETEAVEEPVEVVEETEAVEEPVEVAEETEMVEEPAEVVEETETAEEPAEVAEETETVEEPAEVVEETETVEEPVEVVEETETVEEPAEVVEETETAEEPAEVVEETETAEEPVEAVEETETAEEPAEVAEETETVEEPAEVVEETEAVEEPAEVVEETETAEEPVEVVEEMETAEEPVEVVEETEAVEEPVEVVEETEAVEEPVEVVKETETAEEPAEAVEETETVEDSEEDSVDLSEEEVPLEELFDETSAEEEVVTEEAAEPEEAPAEDNVETEIAAADETPQPVEADEEIKEEPEAAAAEETVAEETVSAEASEEENAEAEDDSEEGEEEEAENAPAAKVPYHTNLSRKERRKLKRMKKFRR